MVVRIDRVTTRGGDKGETSLGDGSRVSKASPIIAAIGALDETNCMLGVLRAHMADSNTAVTQQLYDIQNLLFDMGADLCQPLQDAALPPNSHNATKRLGHDAVLNIERWVENLRKNLKPLQSFVLPGGAMTAAWAHMVRASVRKTERMVMTVAEQTPINMTLVTVLNRLSDYFFVLARHLNDDGRDDTLWQPGL